MRGSPGAALRAASQAGMATFGSILLATVPSASSGRLVSSGLAASLLQRSISALLSVCAKALAAHSESAAHDALIKIARRIPQPLFLVSPDQPRKNAAHFQIPLPPLATHASICPFENPVRNIRSGLPA